MDKTDIKYKFQQLSVLYDEKILPGAPQRQEDRHYMEELRQRVKRWVDNAKNQIDRHGQDKFRVLDEFYDAYVDEIRQKFRRLQDELNNDSSSTDLHGEMNAFNRFIQGNQLKKRLQVGPGNPQVTFDEDIPIQRLPYSDELVDERDIRPLKSPRKEQARLSSYRSKTFSQDDEQPIGQDSSQTVQHSGRDAFSTSDRSARNSFRAAKSVDRQTSQTTPQIDEETFQIHQRRDRKPSGSVRSPEPGTTSSSNTNERFGRTLFRTDSRPDGTSFRRLESAEEETIEAIRTHDEEASRVSQRHDRDANQTNDRSARNSIRTSDKTDRQLSRTNQENDEETFQTEPSHDKTRTRSLGHRDDEPIRTETDLVPSSPNADQQTPGNVQFRDKKALESHQQRIDRNSLRSSQRLDGLSRQSHADDRTSGLDRDEQKHRTSSRYEASPTKSVKFFSQPHEKKIRVLVDTNRQLIINQEQITEYAIDSIQLPLSNDDERARSRLISTDVSQIESETDEHIIREYKTLLQRHDDDEQDSVFLPDQDEPNAHPRAFRLQEFDQENFSTIMLKRFATEYNCFGSSTRRNELVIVNTKLQLITILLHNEDRNCPNRFYFDWPTELDIRDVSDVSYCQRSDQYLFSTFNESEIYALNRDVQTLTKICYWREKLPLSRLHCDQDTLYCIIGKHYLVEYVFDPFKFSLYHPQRIPFGNVDHSRKEELRVLIDVTCNDRHLLVVYVGDRDTIRLRLMDRFSWAIIDDIQIDGPNPINQKSIRIECGTTQKTFVYLNGSQQHFKSIVVGENHRLNVTSTITNRRFQPCNLNFLNDGRLVVLHQNPHFLSIHPRKIEHHD